MALPKNHQSKKFLGALLIAVGLLAGIGSQLRDTPANDRLERGRRLQDAAIPAGLIVVGVVLLVRKPKAAEEERLDQ